METKSRGVVGRWLIGGVVGLLLLAGLGLFALSWYLPTLVFSRVQAAAKAEGVELQHCDGFEFTRDGLEVTHVSLRGCTFSSSLPMQPSGTFEQAEVDVHDEVPTRLSIAGADVRLSGQFQMLELQGQMSPPQGIEITGQRNRVTWVETPGSDPRLQISQIQRLAPADPWTGELLIGTDVQGRFSFGKDLALDLVQRSNTKNVVAVRVDPARFFATLNIDLDGLPMTLLSGVLFHNVPPELLTVQLSGTARFDLPFALNPKQPKGRFKFGFQGLNFPVPQEVAGLVYDTSPEVEGDVEINRTFSKFKLTNLKFATGSLRMKGSGSIERSGVETRWRTSMRGPLPCDAIAAAAAKIHLQGLPLGPELAQAAARISKQAIKGSVDIVVALDAVSTDLAAAKIIKTIGIGCGLKPLPLVGAAQELLKDLPQFPLPTGSVGDILKDLPSLGEFPELPKMPILPKKRQVTEPQTTPGKDD